MPGPSIKYPRYSGGLLPQDYQGGKPILFTVAQFGGTDPMYDVALALYVNPSELSETYTKSKNVVMTYGGFVEWVWPDEISSVSASGSTGGFISPSQGYTAASSKQVGAFGALTGRRGTLAYERFTDLLELFRSNGMVYDSDGTPVVRSTVLMIWDKGVYNGHFSTFSINEDDVNPFTLNLSWEFKIESVVYKILGNPRER